MTTPDAHWRLFIALDLPEAWKRVLETVQHDLQATIAERIAPNIHPRWVKPEGIHLTLRFLGDTPTDRIPALETALGSAVPAAPGFDLALSRVGAFEQRRAPRVILATVSVEGRALLDLRERIETWLAASDWPRDTRTFHPHLTLARLPDAIDDATCRDIAALANAFTPPDVPVWRVDRVHLIRSHLGPTGARYESLSAFPE